MIKMTKRKEKTADLMIIVRKAIIRNDHLSNTEISFEVVKDILAEYRVIQRKAI